MYEIVLINEKGQKFTKEFYSEFLFRKFLNRAKRSKKLTVVSYGRKY